VVNTRIWHRVGTIIAFGLLAVAPRWAWGQVASPVGGDSVSFRFIESDLRAVASSLAPYLSKTLLQTGVPANRVTLETPAPVPRSTVVALLRGLAEGNGLELFEDSLTFRLRPRVVEAPPPAPSAAGPMELHVLRLKHARATDIAGSVNLLFGNGGEFTGRGGIGRSTLSDQLRASAGPAPTATPAGQGATFTGQVTIVPDEVTNSLLIRSSALDLQLVTTAVEQLDIRPLQVLIEVLIVEARKGSSFSLGNAITVPQRSIGDGTAGGGTTGLATGDAVLRLMGLGRWDVDAVIRAAQSKGDVEILSRPVLIAANNTEATFMVGEQRAFPSLKRSHASDGGIIDQEFVYRDVGTRLTVLPTINFDGYVSLEILQEIHQATTEEQLDAPVISTREAHTQVLVRDGQTIVLGGMRGRQRDANRSGIPFLSRIPIIGGLFGVASRSSSESEVYLFLTPRVLRTDGDVDAATAARMPARAAELP
jgi:general secretion pathway protein D